MILMIMAVGGVQVETPDRLLQTKNGMEYVVSKVDDLVNWARKYVCPTELKWPCFTVGSIILCLPLNFVLLVFQGISLADDIWFSMLCC